MSETTVPDEQPVVAPVSPTKPIDPVESTDAEKLTGISPEFSQSIYNNPGIEVGTQYEVVEETETEDEEPEPEPKTTSTFPTPAPHAFVATPPAS